MGTNYIHTHSLTCTQILDAIKKDCPDHPPASLRVDGGMTVNDLLLKLQADLLGIPVGRSLVQL